MNTCDRLPLQESVAQCGAGKHNQWQGYMTFLLVDYGMVKSMSLFTADIRPMIKSDVDNLRDWFHQEVK
jgi:hypothetical protein